MVFRALLQGAVVAVAVAVARFVGRPARVSRPGDAGGLPELSLGPTKIITNWINLVAEGVCCEFALGAGSCRVEVPAAVGLLEAC